MAALVPRAAALALVAALLAAGPMTAFATFGGNDLAAIAQAIHDGLTTPKSPLAAGLFDPGALSRFYEARHFSPVWTGDEAASGRAALLAEAIAHAGDDGLDPADYHAAALSAGEPRDAKEAAQRDLLLTDAFLHYAHDIRLGRVAPGDVDDEISLPPQNFDAAAALQVALTKEGFAKLLVELPPPEPGYARLKDALRRYRALAAAGGWPQVPKGSDELKLESGDPRLAVLRARLAVEDPTLAAAPDHAQPGDLAAALRRFQTRNGLDPDGRVGPRTLAMLNIPASQRVGQIVANLDRWRWLPRPIEQRYIAVNTTDATLQVIEDGKPVLVSKVVVGDPKHPSPILRAVVRAVTVNPPWNVPISIAFKEILPKLRRDPTYLLSQNIVMLNGPEGDPYGVKVDWHSPESRRYLYRLQQLPGPTNSLGSLKLEMPNGFDVYLHDTPSRKLFALWNRTFSHGCIRVEHALELASYVLSGNSDSEINTLKGEIADGTTLHRQVKHPLPVYVLYWTALEGEDGTVEFRADTYRRDARMMAALHSPRHIASSPQTHKGNG